MSGFDLDEFARGLLGPAGSDAVVVMIFAYFDESGTDTAEQVAVSGFIGKLDEWGATLAEWNKELARVGVSPFHRVECKGRSYKGRYRGWTAEQSREHIDRLAKIIGRSTLHPISCAFTGDWSKASLSPEERLWCPSPYHECFESVMTGCMERTFDLYGPDQSIVVIMERQDEFSNWAQAIYDIRKHSDQWPNIVNFSYGDKNTVPYLQFCDLFVWEVRRRMWQLAQNKPIRGDEYPTMWYISARKDFDEKIDLGVYRTEKESRNYRDFIHKEIGLGVRPDTKIPPVLKLDPRNVKRILSHRNQAQGKENSEVFAEMVAYLQAVGGPVEPIDQNYTFDCGTPEQAKWYWVGRCTACGDDAPFFEDRSEGQLQNPFTGHYFFRGSCVHCGAKVSTHLGKIRSVKWYGR